MSKIKNFATRNEIAARYYIAASTVRGFLFWGNREKESRVVTLERVNHLPFDIDNSDYSEFVFLVEYDGGSCYERIMAILDEDRGWNWYTLTPYCDVRRI